MKSEAEVQYPKQEAFSRQPITPSQAPSMNTTQVPITPSQAPSMNTTQVPITPSQAPSMNTTQVPITPSQAPSITIPKTPSVIPSFSTPAIKYDFIEDDMYHRQIETCVDSEKDDVINVYFCMYSITEPFFIEGTSVPIDENTNIYGHILQKYDIRYPCLQWLVERNNNNIYQFPQISYECASIPYSEDDDEEDTDERTMETIRFENAAHEYFLSMFSGDPFKIDSNILKKSYKGYYSPNIENSEFNLTKSVYVIYDFSEIYTLLISNDNKRLIINDELVEDVLPFSPEIKSFFRENRRLRRIQGYISPTIGYMCIYNKQENRFINVSVEHVNDIEYMLPHEHPVLGCNAYYLSKKPLDPDANIQTLVKIACIETRVMYQISINEENEIFYMGDNVEDFKYDFEMGLLMSSTFHFAQNDTEFIGIKNISHIHRIFPALNDSMSSHITKSLTPDTFDKKENLSL